MKMLCIGIAALGLSTATAHAVSVSSAFSSITSLSTTTKMVDADGCVFVGLSPLDRTAPDYIASVKIGLIPPDFSFYTVGPGSCNRPVPPANYGTARDATAGPDNALWVATDTGISRVTVRAGVTATYPVIATALATGSDGNIWYSRSGGIIGKMTTSGQTTESNIGYDVYNSGMMAAGADGNVWMVARVVDGSNAGPVSFVKVTPKGVATSYPIPSVPGTKGLPQSPMNIIAGPDGNMWWTAMTSTTVGAVGKITPTGVTTSWTFTGYTGGGITAGPDGAVWFTALNAAFVTNNGVQSYVYTGNTDRIDPNGVLTEYPTFSYDSGPAGPGNGWTDISMPSIATGDDGNIYVVRYNRNRLFTTVYNAVTTPQEVDFYRIIPDAVATATTPTISILTAGDGQGSIKMSVGQVAGKAAQTVTLTAIIGSNSQFEGWSEPSCTGKSLSCQFDLAGDKTVTATFTVPRSASTTVYQGAVFAAGQQKSYIRIYASHAGIVDANLIDPRSGQIVGSQKEVSLASNGFTQISVDELAPAASADNPAYYTVSLQASNQFNGFVQHVIWNSQAGVVANLTACGLPASLPGLSFVDGSNVSAYPSSIVLTNTSIQNSGPVTLDLFDSNGTQLGSYQGDSIPPKGSKMLAITDVETLSGVHATWPAVSQYVIKPKGLFAGTIQNWVNNSQAGGIYTDQTMACPLSAQ